MTDFSKPADEIPMWESNTLKYMPKMADIPEDFRMGRMSNPFVLLQCEWFFRGLKQWPLTPKPGIDHGKALAHLNFIQRSWDTAHEHKVASVAYLMSLWYEPPKEGRPPREPKAAKPKVKPLAQRKAEPAKVKGPWKPGMPLRGGLN